MIYHIEVTTKHGFRDSHGAHIQRDIPALGISHKPHITCSQVYMITGDLNLRHLQRISNDLLIDPITETGTISIYANKQDVHKNKHTGDVHSVEIWLKAGVTDAVAESVTKAIADLGVDKPVQVRTGYIVRFTKATSPHIIKQIVERLLVNPMIQTYAIH